MQQKLNESKWFRYSLALVASGLALGAELLLNRVLPVALTPFLPAFAAVIASAGWAGFGPGLCATVVSTIWCAVLVHMEGWNGLTGELVRVALFFAEGLLLSIGSGQLRRATREAAGSEHWHRKLVETSAEGIWLTDEAGVLTFANPRIAELLGVGLKDLVGHRMEEFIFPEDLSVERIRIQNRPVGMKEQFDRRLRHTDGSEVWLLTCSNTFRNPNDGALGVLSMMTDITERKKAEHALRRSEEKFRELFENVLEGVYQSTPEGRILAANPMLLRMLGMTSEAEMNDVNIARDLYVDTTVRTRLLERLERAGSFQNVEYELRRRDRQIITVQENARVVRDEEGRVLYYEGTLTDITDRKRMEARLRQAQKMEALGRLAGGVAHDFSNILTVVSGYAHLIASELPAAHPARSSARLLVQAADSAAVLTEQLLSFSQRGPHPAVITDLSQALRDTEKALRDYLEERSDGPANLEVRPSSEPLPVQADAGHIRQILMNLTVNVRDAVGTRAALCVSTESIRVQNDSSPGLFAKIRVSAASAAEGWESQRAELADGLGISTTQAIVSQYGGFMVMDRSAVGSLAFAIFLPLADETAHAGAADPGLSEEAGGETILLVDDEPLVREISRDMLERHGYRVLVAPGPSEAERMVQQHRTVDLLITELTLPQISGPEFARRMRTRNPGLKVLFLAEYTDTPTAEAGLSITDTFLQRPFSADALGRKIRQLLDQN